MYYVYILKGERYYVWYTDNIERRLDEHINDRQSSLEL